jgi:GTPase SAR1 family protein
MNARENPFETDRIERLLSFDPAWLGLDWDEILEWAAAMDYRGAIVGPHGSGKTTFCDAFSERLSERGFSVIRWFLNVQKTNPNADELAAIRSPEMPESAILLIDGTEFLSAANWRKLYRDTAEVAGLFATIHQEKRLPKPRLPVFLETKATPEMLSAFVKRLAPDVSWDESDLREIFDARDGNLREALWTCYDRMASGCQKEISPRSDSPV